MLLFMLLLSLKHGMVWHDVMIRPMYPAWVWFGWVGKSWNWSWWRGFMNGGIQWGGEFAHHDCYYSSLQGGWKAGYPVETAGNGNDWRWMKSEEWERETRIDRNIWLHDFPLAAMEVYVCVEISDVGTGLHDCGGSSTKWRVQQWEIMSLWSLLTWYGCMYVCICDGREEPLSRVRCLVFTYHIHIHVVVLHIDKYVPIQNNQCIHRTVQNSVPPSGCSQPISMSSEYQGTVMRPF